MSMMDESKELFDYDIKDVKNTLEVMTNLDSNESAMVSNESISESISEFSNPVVSRAILSIESQLEALKSWALRLSDTERRLRAWKQTLKNRQANLQSLADTLLRRKEELNKSVEAHRWELDEISRAKEQLVRDRAQLEFDRREAEQSVRKLQIACSDIDLQIHDREKYLDELQVKIQQCEERLEVLEK